MGGDAFAPFYLYIILFSRPTRCHSVVSMWPETIGLFSYLLIEGSALNRKGRVFVEMRFRCIMIFCMCDFCAGIDRHANGRAQKIFQVVVGLRRGVGHIESTWKRSRRNMEDSNFDMDVEWAGRVDLVMWFVAIIKFCCEDICNTYSCSFLKVSNISAHFCISSTRSGQ